MALRHENVFYKHALQGFLARLIWQTKRWYRLAWACIPTILHAQLSQINTVISGERHKLFNNYNDPGFISSLYQSYSLKLNFKNWILSFLYLQNPHLWSKAMLLAPVMQEKQRRDLTNSHTGRLSEETGLQNIKITGLDCPVLPHFLLFSIARKLRWTFHWSCTPCYWLQPDSGTVK